MKYQYNRDLILGNINAFLKKKGMLIGEFELKLQVSKGYLSRLKDNKSGINVEFLMAVCNILDCDMDDLIRISASELSPTETFIKRFIDRLEKETYQGNIGWKADDYLWILDLYTSPLGERVPAQVFEWEHPLFRRAKTDNGSFDKKMPPYSYCPIYSFSGRTVPADDFFSAPIKIVNGQTIKQVYITKICLEGDEEKIDYELFLYTPCEGFSPEKVEGICSTRNSSDKIKILMEHLYQSAKEATSKIFLNNDIKNSLTEFIEEGVVDKKNPDEEIPF